MVWEVPPMRWHQQIPEGLFQDIALQVPTKTN